MQAFACEVNAEIFDEDIVNTYVSQWFSRNNPPHQGRFFYIRGGRQPTQFPPGRSVSEQRTNFAQSTSPVKLTRDLSNTSSGCGLCGSLQNDVLG